MPFPVTGTWFFPEKSGKFPVPSIWKHPLPGTISVPTLFEKKMVSVGIVFKKNCRKFLVQYWISRKVLDFSSSQDHSRISRMVLCSPVPSLIFPKFFLDFLEQRDQKTVVLFQYSQFGKWPPVSSCLVLKKARNADL